MSETIIFVKPFDNIIDISVISHSKVVGDLALYYGQLHLDDSGMTLMDGFYELVSSPSRGVHLYKWKSDQTSLFAISTSSLPSPNSKWTPMPISTDPYAPTKVIQDFTAIIDEEPACFCKSPSEHAADCQYIKWKRRKK